LLYLLAATPLAPAMTALLAAFDGSHDVALQRTANGPQVVLQHDCVNLATHRHGMVALSLTLFAQRTTPSQPDHVIQFGAVDSLRQSSPPIIAPAPQFRLLAAFVRCDFLLPPLRLTSSLVNLPRPPPATSGILFNLRSTVLVI
jgi:hypothetical protein